MIIIKLNMRGQIRFVVFMIITVDTYVVENTAKNVKTRCIAPSPRCIRDKHHESTKTLYLKGRERKVLSIVKGIVHSACAGVVESAIRQSVCAFNDASINNDDECDADEDVIEHVQVSQ